MCSWRAASMFFLASSKLLPRTMTDSFSQTSLQPSSSGQKLQSTGTPAITRRLTASDFIGTPFLTLDRTSASPMAKVNESAEEVPTRKTVKHMFDPRLIENMHENASEHN